MITYTSSDIIKRAEQLADIENSDFIGFSEKIALLNEAYTSVYQKLINRGDDAFIRILNADSNVITLPSDFFQLKCINLVNDAFTQQVLRRPQNQNRIHLSFDLRGDKLIINGNHHGSTACIEYYPVPQTLTFPSPRIQLSSGTVIAMNGTMYVEKDSDGSLYLKDLNDSGVYEEIIYSGTLQTVHMEADAVSIITSTASYIYDLASGTKLTISGGIPAVYMNRTFVYKDGSLYFPGGTSVAYTTGTLDIDESDIIALSDDFGRFVGLDGSTVITGNASEHSTLSLKQPATNLAVNKGTVYLVTGTPYLAAYSFTDGKLHETLRDHAVLDVVGFNDDTGYGFLTTKLGVRYVESFFDDTRLNFPNNFYFTYIAYQLAIAFKSKQGSDPSQLLELASRAEETFYDTLTRDDWGTMRITNAY